MFVRGSSSWGQKNPNSESLESVTKARQFSYCSPRSPRTKCSINHQAGGRIGRQALFISMDTQIERRRNRGGEDWPHWLFAVSTTTPISTLSTFSVRCDAPSCNNITLLKHVRCDTPNDETTTSHVVLGNSLPGTSTCSHMRCRTTFAPGRRRHKPASISTDVACAQVGGVLA